MDINIYAILVGFAGALFVMLTKMRSLQILSEKANVAFSYKRYFEKEVVSIAISILSVFVWQLLFNEVAAKYKALDGFMLTSFFIMGAAGSWIIQKLLGKTQSWINSKIDAKTNELDELKSNQ